METQPLQNLKLSFKCPKQLNELQPCNGDWYCDGCHKIVHDFRGMSEAQILGIIKNVQRPCGIFEAGRVEVISQQNKWLKWASAAMVFLGLASCTEQVQGKVKIAIDTLLVKKPSNVLMVGKVYNAPQQSEAIPTLPETIPDKDAYFAGAIEVFPEFPGGEVALRKFLYQRLKYNGEFQGRAFVQFYVEKDGSLTDIKILRGGTTELNDQIIDIFKHSPKWKPGMENGKACRVMYTVPVNIALK